MNIAVRAPALPALIDRAAKVLSSARSSAEILEAREMASAVYDMAKTAARLAKAKGAHDALIAAVHRTQADALEIEAGAKRRLADEYDAAQERNEIASHGGDRSKFPDEKLAPASEIIPPKELHEARIIRDAEEADPGIVKRTLDDAIKSGEEPTRAKVRRAVKAKSKRTRKPRFTAPVESQHDRDLRSLIGMWDASCDSAREAFQKYIAQ